MSDLLEHRTPMKKAVATPPILRTIAGPVCEEQVNSNRESFSRLLQAQAPQRTGLLVQVGSSILNKVNDRISDTHVVKVRAMNEHQCQRTCIQSRRITAPH